MAVEIPSETNNAMGALLTHYGADISRTPIQGWRTIKCPFHEDNHPSGRVNLGRGAYWCPVCDKSGDTISLIKKIEGVDTRSAFEWANDVLGESRVGIPFTTSDVRRTNRPVGRYSLFG